MAGSDSLNQSLLFLTEKPSVSDALSWTAVLKSCHCVLGSGFGGCCSLSASLAWKTASISGWWSRCTWSFLVCGPFFLGGCLKVNASFASLWSV